MQMVKRIKCKHQILSPRGSSTYFSIQIKISAAKKFGRRYPQQGHGNVDAV